MPYLFVNPPPDHLISNMSRIAIIDVFINTLFLMLDATLSLSPPKMSNGKLYTLLSITRIPMRAIPLRYPHLSSILNSQMP